MNFWTRIVLVLDDGRAVGRTDGRFVRGCGCGRSVHVWAGLLLLLLLLDFDDAPRLSRIPVQHRRTFGCTTYPTTTLDILRAGTLSHIHPSGAVWWGWPLFYYCYATASGTKNRERATNEPKDRPTDPCDWMDEEMSGGGVVGGRAKTIIQLPWPRTNVITIYNTFHLFCKRVNSCRDR